MTTLPEPPDRLGWAGLLLIVLILAAALYGLILFLAAIHYRP